VANVRSLTLAAAAGYVAATIAAVVTILLWTQNLETIAVGFLDPVFMLPGLIAYVVASAIRRCNNWRTPLYWVLVTPWPLFCFSVALFPSPGARADGADQLALAFAIPAVASCVVCYLVLLVWHRTGRSKQVADRDGI
jgi:hypothetical protein